MKIIDPWFLENLACPRCYAALTLQSGRLSCHQNHAYEMVDGIPILLDPEVQLYTPIRTKNLDRLASENMTDSLEVDPFVQSAIAATNGIMYRSLIGKLKRYPIPKIPLSPGRGRWLLDIGCNWGRWSIAAAQKGYRVVGVDPNPEAIFAARRICQKFGLDAKFIVADARHLPFLPERFDQVFSYSVLQHFAKDDVRLTLDGVGRILKPGGSSLIEMANAQGLRSFMHQLQRGFREPREFEVRYWQPRELIETLGDKVGRSQLQADGFFCLNPQSSDLPFLPLHYRAIVFLSECIKRLTTFLPLLTGFADSIYVASQKPEAVLTEKTSKSVSRFRSNRPAENSLPV